MQISGINTISITPGTEHLMKSDKSVSVNSRCSEYKETNNPASYFKGGGTLERKFLLDTIRILI